MADSCKDAFQPKLGLFRWGFAANCTVFRCSQGIFPAHMSRTFMAEGFEQDRDRTFRLREAYPPTPTSQYQLSQSERVKTLFDPIE